MFIHFKAEMQKSFDEMIKDEDVIYITDVDKEQLWETYLNSFTNPVLPKYSPAIDNKISSTFN